MKKAIITVGILAVLFFSIIVLFCVNAFGIRDWIIKNADWSLEQEERSVNATNELDSTAATKAQTQSLCMLTDDLMEEVKYSEPLKEKLEESIFPQGAYLNGYHIAPNEWVEGEVFEQFHPYIYNFQIIIPEGTLEDFLALLRENNYEQRSGDSNINGEWYVSEAFGRYPKAQYTYAFSYVYYLDEETFRSVGNIQVDIIEQPGKDPVIIITAY